MDQAAVRAGLGFVRFFLRRGGGERGTENDGDTVRLRWRRNRAAHHQQAARSTVSGIVLQQRAPQTPAAIDPHPCDHERSDGAVRRSSVCRHASETGVAVAGLGKLCRDFKKSAVLTIADGYFFGGAINL